MARTVRYLPPSARGRHLSRNRQARPQAGPPEVQTAPVAPEVQTAPVAPVAPVEPVEPTEPVRAHDDDGHFVADDPATPEFNEAFIEGKPVKASWNDKMTKGELLKVLSTLGLEGVTMDNTKKQIVAALTDATG